MENRKILTKTYCRTCGYYAPTDCFNPGKLAEQNERILLKTPEGMNDSED